MEKANNKEGQGSTEGKHKDQREIITTTRKILFQGLGSDQLSELSERAKTIEKFPLKLITDTFPHILEAEEAILSR